MKKSISLVLLILFLLQRLLMPKYVVSSPEGNLIGEFYQNCGGNDVLFIGDCEVYESFVPPILWETAGIPSIIRGSPQQTLWQSYYLLEDSLRYEAPSAVVLNLLAMKYDTPESTGSQEKREAYNRMTLDGMRWSASKLGAIRSSLTREERRWGGVLTYLFPILRFHSRWQDLRSEDFRWFFTRPEISCNGYLVQTGVSPVTQLPPEPPGERMEFGENSWYWLNRIEALCREKGIELILVKAPSLSPTWYPQWEAQIRDYAENHSLAYYHFLEMDLGLDWQRDTYDGGLHLNAAGAEKLSRCFASLLAQNHGLPDRRREEPLSSAWQKKAEIYRQRITTAGEQNQ